MEEMLKKIIVFGRGKYFKRKEATLRQQYEIVAFLDNSVIEKEYDETYQCYIYNPAHIHELPDCNVICLSIHFLDMWKQLISLGVSDARIQFGMNLQPVYESDRALFSNGETLISTGGKLEYTSVWGSKHYFTNEEEYCEFRRKIFCEQFPEVRAFQQFRTQPASNAFGCERGKAVDRYYIEKFLNANSEYVRGDVMEIASNNYIRRYGGDKVTSEIILHVKGWGKNAIKGNFETGEGLRENMVDCLICTQTLQYIYDLKSAVKNIFKILKPGGVGLFTLPGIKSLSPSDDNNWGEYWSFTRRSALRLFADQFGEENVEVATDGNVKVTMAYLYGICLEDMNLEDMEYNDSQFPFIITVKVFKKQG